MAGHTKKKLKPLILWYVAHFHGCGSSDSVTREGPSLPNPVTICCFHLEWIRDISTFLSLSRPSILASPFLTSHTKQTHFFFSLQYEPINAWRRLKMEAKSWHKRRGQLEATATFLLATMLRPCAHKDGIFFFFETNPFSAPLSKKSYT